MTVAAAESFLRQAVSTPVLVQQINAAPDKATVEKIFSELGMRFDSEEFQQAYFNLLTCCQTEVQANAVKEVKLWWDCLEYTFSTNQSKL